MSSASNKGSAPNIIFTIIVVTALMIGGFLFADSIGSDEPRSIDTSQDTSSDTGSDVSVAAKPVETEVDLPVVDLQGDWIASENGRDFSANVSNGNISIELGNADVTMLYWNGTFDTANTSGSIIVSQKVEMDRPVMSRAVSKEFTFENDKLSFTFEIMGTKRTVVMDRA